MSPLFISCSHFSLLSLFALFIHLFSWLCPQHLCPRIFWKNGSQNKWNLVVCRTLYLVVPCQKSECHFLCPNLTWGTRDEWFSTTFRTKRQFPSPVSGSNAFAQDDKDIKGWAQRVIPPHHKTTVTSMSSYRTFLSIKYLIACVLPSKNKKLNGRGADNSSIQF